MEWNSTMNINKQFQGVGGGRRRANTYYQFHRGFLSNGGKRTATPHLPTSTSFASYTLGSVEFLSLSCNCSYYFMLCTIHALVIWGGGGGGTSSTVRINLFKRTSSPHSSHEVVLQQFLLLIFYYFRRLF